MRYYNQMSPVYYTQYCEERNQKTHHWLIKDTKNPVSNTVSSCRYEHQEMGQMSGGKRGSLALTVSGYILYCTLWFIYFWLEKSLLVSIADISTGRTHRHRNSGISARFRSILISDFVTLFLYRTGSSSAFLFRFRSDRIPDSPAFKKFYEVGRKSSWTSKLPVVERDTPCTSIHGWYSGVILDIWCFKITSKCRNAGEKVMFVPAFLPSVSWLSLASAFQHHGQSGTAGHGLVLQSPAMLIYISTI